MHRYAEIAVSSLKEALLFNLVGIVAALGALFLVRTPVGDSFGFIILIESTGLLLVGGAIGVAGQATSRKISEYISKRLNQKLDLAPRDSSDAKAAFYSLTGIILFVEGAVMAAIFA